MFLRHLAQTSSAPMFLEIEQAAGIYLIDKDQKKYIDLISGISVSNVGHRHPHVLQAIEAQLKKYMHLMVYGEYIQSPQVLLSKKLTALLPPTLDNVYFVNSGSEAVEGAMKLAKRYTGRTEIIACRNAYHGSTQGALSLMSSEYFMQSFRPLIPDISFIDFNKEDQLSFITSSTAAIFIETVQAEAGIIPANAHFLKKVRQKCNETGTLLVMDEIQTGFGRTGTLFSFEQYQVVPDILLLAKGMGGGMPIGCFIASKKIMQTLSNNPVLGHITTFGGHPVSCAAAIATLEVVCEEIGNSKIIEKEKIFLKHLKHPLIKAIRSKGLLIAIEFETEKINKAVISKCIENGVIVDWFLFNSQSMRIAPPLIISEQEIKQACEKILLSLDQL